MTDKDIICALIPHRPPFLMVDRIDGYSPGKNRTLTANRVFKKEEKILEYAKGSIIVPSVYLIEGLGQCCNLLSIFRFVENQEGISPSVDEVVQKVALLSKKDNEGIGGFSSINNTGLLASVEIEISGVVVPGEKVCFEVREEGQTLSFIRFAVKASVEDRVVAHGIMAGSDNRYLETK